MRERRGFVVVFGVLLIASLLPIWLVRYHPISDLANHIAAVALWRNYRDPAFDAARYYTLSLGLNPYWGYYEMLRLLAAPFGLWLANRFLLSFYIVALPLGMATLARRFQRSPWLALFAFPLLWNFSFNAGFFPFCFGLSVLPWALVAFDAYCEQPGWARGTLAALSGVAVYFCHLLPWGMFLACAGLIGLLHEGRSPRRILGRLGVWAVPLVAGGLVLRLGKGKGMGLSGYDGTHHPLGEMAREFYDWVWNNCSGHEDEIMVAVLLLCWLALRATARQRWRWHDLRAEACTLTALVAYFVLPRSIVKPIYWWGINVRFACITLLFLGLCIPGSVEGWRRWLLLPVALVGLAFAVDCTLHWRRADRLMEGFDAIATTVPEHQRVLFLVERPWHEPGVNQNYAQSYPAFYTALRGGYNPWLFDDGFPLVYRERFPAPSWQSRDFVWDRHARYYDYVITFQMGTRDFFIGHQQEVLKVKEAGSWILWKLPGPRVEAPPGPAYPSAWALDSRWSPPPP